MLGARSGQGFRSLSPPRGYGDFSTTLEDKIIDNAYPDGKEINGVGPKDIKQYIRYLADRRLIQLGLNSNWHVRENPIAWINHIIGGDSHQNFFEGRVADYTAKPMTGSWEWGTII